ncbi:MULTISPECIES: glycosyltransferase 61 family protein [unclassified Asaia]|uniref:glycosyltransferase 61 family protein n=1 Tax=unclassified Asaia TaxID=2685023 RepID=UPI0013153103|nr:glycosyltransferase 61 family protein [Asaia sp. W19]
MFEESICCDEGLKTFLADPAIRILEDGLYVPRIPGHYDRNFGLYDIYGRLVQEAGPRRGWPTQPLGQSASCCVSPSSSHPRAPEGCYFYGGNINDHFGHFLTETLPRYWCYRERYAGMKILVHAEKTLDTLFSQAWIAGFFALLGLGQSDFVVFERPTRLRMLVVAGTSLEENHFAHQAFARFCNDLGEENGIGIAESRPLYLSRAAFNSQMRMIRGEEAMLPLLRQEGIAIIEPEKLSIRQQIGLFSAHRPTIGFVGSAFHTSIFCARPVGVALTCDGLISSNHALMDRVNRARIRYLTTPGILVDRFIPGQPALYRLEEPRRVVRHLLDAIEGRIWARQPVSAPPEKIEGACFLLQTYHQTWLMIDRQTGIVQHGSGDGERALRLVVRLDGRGWAAISAPTGDCLTMERDNTQGTTLFYRYRTHGQGKIFLFSHENGFFVCPTPDGRVLCDRPAPAEWEELTLISPH